MVAGLIPLTGLASGLAWLVAISPGRPDTPRDATGDVIPGSLSGRVTVEIVGISGVFLPVFRVRAHTPMDRIDVRRGKIRSRPFLREVLPRDDLRARLTEFEQPLCIFVGCHDRTATPGRARGRFDAIEAPVKGGSVFGNSAHSRLVEEPGRAMETVLNDVLPGGP